MKLQDSLPANWKDLQVQVTRLFREAGYGAEMEKTIPLVRGSVEVDVYVEAQHELLKTVVCECKYWSTPVPQEKVHAFRMTVQDSGTMLGIMISKNGFQSGAIEAAKMSNVILKTWDEFQQMIIVPWVRNRVDALYEEIYPLFVYTDMMDASRHVKKEIENQYKKVFNRTAMYGQSVLILLYEIKRETQKFIDQPSYAFKRKTYTSFKSLFDDVEKKSKSIISEFEKVTIEYPFSEQILSSRGMRL